MNTFVIHSIRIKISKTHTFFNKSIRLLLAAASLFVACEQAMTIRWCVSFVATIYILKTRAIIIHFYDRSIAYDIVERRESHND